MTFSKTLSFQTSLGAYLRVRLVCRSADVLRYQKRLAVCRSRLTPSPSNSPSPCAKKKSNKNIKRRRRRRRRRRKTRTKETKRKKKKMKIPKLDMSKRLSNSIYSDWVNSRAPYMNPKATLGRRQDRDHEKQLAQIIVSRRKLVTEPDKFLCFVTLCRS